MNLYNSLVLLMGLFALAGFSGWLAWKNMSLRQEATGLKKELAHTQHYLDTAQTLMVALDDRGRVIMVNRAALELLGYEKKELLGRHWFLTCLPQPEGMETVYPVYRQIMAGQLHNARYFENPVTCRDGRQRLVAWRNAYLRNENGDIIGTLASGQDITERRQMEDALKQSEELLRESQAVAHLGHYSFYVNTGQWTSSRELDAIFGIDEHYQRDVEGWLDLVHPDFRADLRVYFQEHVLGRGRKFDREYKIIHQGDNRDKWVHGLGNLKLDQNGEVTGMFGTIQDITTRKRTEAALLEQKMFLETIFNNEPECVKVVNGKGKLLRMNPAGLRMIEVADEEEANEFGLLNFVLPGYRAPFTVLLQRVMEGESGKLLFPIQGRRGTQRWLETHAAPLPDAEGHITAMLAVTRDVSERRRTELALRQSQANLLRAQYLARMGDFIWELASGEVEWSDGMYHLLKYDKHESINLQKVNAQIHHPQDRESVNQWLRECIADEAENFPPNEYRLICRDGEVLDVQTNLRVERVAGQAIRVFGTCQDISARKRAEEIMLESERRYRELFENSRDGFVVVDARGYFLNANRAFLQMLGYSLEELRHMDFYAVTPPRWHAWERHEIWEKRLLKEGYSGIYEKEYIRRDGSEFTVELQAHTFFNQRGELLYLWGIARDITERKQIENQLKESEERFRRLAENAQDIIYRFELLPDPGFSYVSPVAEKITGYSPRDYYRDPDFSLKLTHPEDRDKLKNYLQDEDFFREPVVMRWLRKDGLLIWIEQTNVPIYDSQARLCAMEGIARDITERKHAEEKLQLAASVFTHAREGITITDARGNIVEVNEAFTHITGYSREEALGKNPRILKSNRQERGFYLAMWEDLSKKGHWYGEVWNRRKNGDLYAVMLTISSVSDNQGRIQHYVGLFSDITEQKEHQRQLEYTAHYDALTGLPNRVLLADRLHQAIIQAQRRGQRLAVAYLDLDGFKEVNDTYGHKAGDQLLTQLARRMKQALREGDTIARLGGDEFVAVLIDLADIHDALPIIGRLLDAAARPVHLGGHRMMVSASLGVTFYPQAEEKVDPDQLLRQADQAMYQAKLAGKNRYYIFDAEQDKHIRGHHESLERIRQALHADEFVLYYQPKVNMRTGRIVGAEALIRWQHPERGLLLPAEFLPLIEERPLAVEVGEWVIGNTLKQLETWRRAGLEIPVSVNVGARQLQQPDFMERLRILLARHPTIKPEFLELEMLETCALEDITQVSSVIRACNEIGVRFALDDFGTGYSSLTYLKRLPAAQLKIDQSFVRDMLDDAEELAILEGVLGLATAFRRQAIAEGVETLAHGEMLLQLGCELAQGIGIAAPMPGEELMAWINDWRPDPGWLKQSQISRDDVPLLFAGVEHRAWIRAIQDYLRGHRAMPPPLDHHQCRFGYWLEHGGRERHGAQPIFQEIEHLHHQVHRLARELIHLKTENQFSEASSRLNELEQLRDALLSSLTKLLQKRLPT